MKTPRRNGEESSATIAQAVVLALGCLMLCALTALGAPPTWWSTPGTSAPAAVLAPQVVTNNGVVTTNYAPNDYAAVNQGQLKRFTSRAVDYLNANLSGGAGTNLNGLVQGWAQDYATNGYNSTNLKPTDYTAMNQGQLKFVGNKVWSRLVSAGYTANPPTWLASNTNSDHAVANLGQLKQLFNFDLTRDTDNNGLPDWWELKYFGQLGNVALSSPTQNGFTLLQDYQAGADPTNYYSQPTSGGTSATLIVPVVTIVSGNNQTGTPNASTDAPLVVRVATSSGGAVLPYAPVRFTAGTSGGSVRATFGGASAASVTVIADSNGYAQAYYVFGSGNNVAGTVQAAGGTGASVSFTETTTDGTGTFDAPSNVVAVSASATEIDVSWVNHATTATGIEIDQSTNNVTWTPIAQLTDPTATTYAATNLVAGQTYNFRVAGTK